MQIEDNNQQPQIQKLAEQFIRKIARGDGCLFERINSFDNESEKRDVKRYIELRKSSSNLDGLLTKDTETAISTLLFKTNHIAAYCRLITDVSSAISPDSPLPTYAQDYVKYLHLVIENVHIQHSASTFVLLNTNLEKLKITDRAMYLKSLYDAFNLSEPRTLNDYLNLINGISHILFEPESSTSSLLKPKQNYSKIQGAVDPLIKLAAHISDPNASSEVYNGIRILFTFGEHATFVFNVLREAYNSNEKDTFQNMLRLVDKLQDDFGTDPSTKCAAAALANFLRLIEKPINESVFNELCGAIKMPERGNKSIYNAFLSALTPCISPDSLSLADIKSINKSSEIISDWFDMPNYEIPIALITTEFKKALEERFSRILGGGKVDIPLSPDVISEILRSLKELESQITVDKTTIPLVLHLYVEALRQTPTTIPAGLRVANQIMVTAAADRKSLGVLSASPYTISARSLFSLMYDYSDQLVGQISTICNSLAKHFDPYDSLLYFGRICDHLRIQNSWKKPTFEHFVALNNLIDACGSKFTILIDLFSSISADGDFGPTALEKLASEIRERSADII